MADGNEPKAPAPGKAYGYFLAAIVLFAIALTVPRLPRLLMSPTEAATFGLNDDLRGAIKLEFTVLRDGTVTSSAPVAGDRLRVAYDGDGYLYIRTIGIRADGSITSLVPKTPDEDVFGRRAEPGGGATTSAPIPAGTGPLVLYTIFGAVPLRFEVIAAELRAALAAGRSPADAARSIHFPGRAVVTVFEAP